MTTARIIRSASSRTWSEAGPAARGALLLLTAVVLVAVVSPLAGYTPGADADPSRTNVGPSLQHWLGTDHLGRDVAWRLALASRAFVLPGAVASGVAIALGVGLGATSGWIGGSRAAALRGATAILASIPRFVLVLLVCAAWGSDLPQLAIAVGLAYTPVLAEAVHGRLTSMRTADYLLAARAHGVSPLRTLWVHGVLAGCGRLVCRHAVQCFAYFLVVETTLAYIGDFGVQEPTPSWGNMLAFEWGWSLAALPPAIALWIVIAALTWLADGLAEVRDE